MTKRFTLDQRAAELMAIAPQTGVRLDANETAVFARQLEQIESRLFDVKYPEGHAVELVPLLTSIDPGAAEYTYRFFDYQGEARRIANDADDLPRVDIQGQEVTTRMHSYGASYGYSIQEMRAAAMANLPLEQKRANAARLVLVRKLDNLLWFGDSQVNITGLANHASVTPTAVATGTWSSATGLQMLGDAQKLCSAAPLATKGVERPDTLCMSITQFEKFSTTPIGDNADKTALEFFMKSCPWIKRVVPTYQLELADAEGDGGRMVAFEANSEKLEGLVSIEFMQHPPQAKNFAFAINCEMRCGGVAIRYPGSVRYMDGC